MQHRITYCTWPGDDPIMRRYHDREWGVPLHNDRTLFEFMVLDAFQAGLSWRTVLHKRRAFANAFADFNPKRVAAFTSRDISRCLRDPGIIRNRQKVAATVKNARAFLELQAAEGSAARFLWQFVGGAPIVHHYRTDAQIPARSQASDAMSAGLRALGFSFVGSTICYAFMQAAGMVNDHLVGCPRWRACQRQRPLARMHAPC